MKNKYELLVTDIDGTLVNKDGVISDTDLKALQNIRQKGVMISLCTGRAAGGCHKILDKLAMDGFHIFFDGALVVNSKLNKTIYIRPIEKKLLRQVCDLVQSEGITLELFSQTQFYISQQNALTAVHSQLLDFKPLLSDFSTVISQEDIILGCIVITNSEEKQILSLCSGLESRLRICPTIAPSRPDIRMINITAQGVDKGTALTALISHLGIKPENVIAIGDGANDVSFLANSGLAVAMQNAPDELKDIADYVTADAEHSGIAQAINHFFPDE
jgi:Cof subfamily protein (haloacid dehalogenase superfamily)